MDPLLADIYQQLKTLYKDLPQVMVLTGKEYNAFEEDPDGRLDDEECVVVCDNPADEYCTDGIFHIDGAFSIEIARANTKYIWWPYPEEPIMGNEAIINHIKKYHFPNADT